MMNAAAFKEMPEVSERKIIADSPLGKLSEGKTFKPMSEYDLPLGFIRESYLPIEGNSGNWDGERGDSTWRPDRDSVPLKSNPEGKTWGEILDKYGIDGIPFKDGEPDFGEISKGDVKIEPFSTERSDNFDKADQKLAEQKGCTPEEVAKWRKENGYTWHECKDMETMQKVPSEVHNNVPHSGGISEAKKGQGE